MSCEHSIGSSRGRRQLGERSRTCPATGVIIVIDKLAVVVHSGGIVIAVVATPGEREVMRSTTFALCRITTKVVDVQVVSAGAHYFMEYQEKSGCSAFVIGSSVPALTNLFQIRRWL